MHARPLVVGLHDYRLRRKPLPHVAAKTGADFSAARVDDHAALQPRAIVRELPEAIKHEVNEFFPDGIMPAGKVVRGALLPPIAWSGRKSCRYAERPPCTNPMGE